MFLDFYFREFTAVIILFLFQVLVGIGEYDVIFSKNTTRVEIILTISTAIHIRIAKSLAHIL